MSQICTKCSKPGEFRVGHLQCLECERAYGRAQYAMKRERYVSYRELHREKLRKQNVEISRRNRVERHAEIDRIKSVACKDCKLTFAPHVMDFDHRDPSSKSFEISFAVNKTTCPWSRILTELAKCDVVCVCCHRLRTWSTPKNPIDARRQLIVELKNVPCADCRMTFHYCQMDFDHVRGEKIREVPLLKNRMAILTEAAKCDVVCANCHRERSQIASKGSHRLDPKNIDMTWRRRQNATPQSLIIGSDKRGRSSRPWHSLVGTMPDSHVAIQAGVAPATVHNFRKKIGIPKFQSSKIVELTRV